MCVCVRRTVAACAAKKRLVVPETESVCGRPLGLQFHRASGDLYYADAYLGLMRVGRRGGLAEAVATKAGGAPLNFVNGVDVDQDTGHVYFTESSATFQRRYVRAFWISRYSYRTVYLFCMRTCTLQLRAVRVSFGLLLLRPLDRKAVINSKACVEVEGVDSRADVSLRQR